MFCFKVEKRIEILIKECLEMVKKLNIPISNSIYFSECGGHSKFGCCTKYGHSKKKGYDFVIKINKFLLEDKAIKETVIHELLHTILSCKTPHGTEWKHYANLCSKTYNLNISRTAKYKLESKAYSTKSRRKIFLIEEYNPETMEIITCPKCHKQYAISKLIKHKTKKSKWVCKKCKVPFYYE